MDLEKARNKLNRELDRMRNLAGAKSPKDSSKKKTQVKKEKKKVKKSKATTLKMSTVYSKAVARGFLASSKFTLERPLLAGVKRESKTFKGVRDIADSASRFFLSTDVELPDYFDFGLKEKRMIVSGSFPSKKIILFDAIKVHEFDYDSIIRMERAAVLNDSIDFIDFRPVGLGKLALNIQDVQASDIRMLLVAVKVQFKDGVIFSHWMVLTPLALRVSE